MNKLIYAIRNKAVPEQEASCITLLTPTCAWKLLLTNDTTMELSSVMSDDESHVEKEYSEFLSQIELIAKTAGVNTIICQGEVICTL